MVSVLAGGVLFNRKKNDLHLQYLNKNKQTWMLFGTLHKTYLTFVKLAIDVYSRLDRALIRRCHLTSIRNSIVEIRQSYEWPSCLHNWISTIWFPVLVIRHLVIESVPRFLCSLILDAKHPCASDQYAKKISANANWYIFSKQIRRMASPQHSHPPTCQMLVIITEGR